MLEQKVTEQDGVIQSMKLDMKVAAAEQGALLHKINKEIRQHTVDKQDAVDEATKAREDLAFVKQKTANRIRSLERDVMNKAKEKMDMQTILDGRVASIEEFNRDMVNQRRMSVNQSGVVDRRQTR